MIRIITDSTSDISQQEAAQLGITVIPLKVVFGQEALREGVDITPEEFYARLAGANPLPTTSQPAPSDFLPDFLEAKQAGDSVVAVLLSGKISGTVQSAMIARDMAGYDPIFIVDSLSAVTGLRLLVEQALRLRELGRSAAEIAAELEEKKSRVMLLGLVDTLEYFYRGGRLSRTGKIAGTLLGFKPLLMLRDGALTMLGKARGSSAGIELLLREVEQRGCIDPSAPVYFGYTLTDEKCRMLRSRAVERFALREPAMFSVGCVIGTHAGPGACVFTYLAQK